MTRVKLILCALLFNAALWGGALFMTAPRAQARGGCAQTYVVRYGDWLAQIARQHNTSVSVLIQLNPELWWNPNLIFPGQELCLPGAPPRTMALEATFEYAPNKQIPVIEGKRATYQLSQALVVTDTAKRDAALTGSPAPAALLVKNENAAGYALFEIGTPNLTASTQITPTEALNLAAGCDAQPVKDVIVSMHALTATLEFAIERPDGFRVPLEVSDIGLLKQASNIKTCFDKHWDRIIAILYPDQNKRNAYWALVPGQELQGVVGPSPWWIYYSFFWGYYSYY